MNPATFSDEPSEKDKAIAKLVQTINDDPYKNHLDLTPSVYKLIDFGLDVIPHITPLLKQDDEIERERAQRVLEGVTMPLFGFSSSKGWPSFEHEQKWKQFWSDLGSLNPQQKQYDREKCIKLWNDWYDSRKKK